VVGSSSIRPSGGRSFNTCDFRVSVFGYQGSGFGVRVPGLKTSIRPSGGRSFNTCHGESTPETVCPVANSGQAGESCEVGESGQTGESCEMGKRGDAKTRVGSATTAFRSQHYQAGDRATCAPRSHPHRLVPGKGDCEVQPTQKTFLSPQSTLGDEFPP
jgi:hypothetical protein